MDKVNQRIPWMLLLITVASSFFVCVQAAPSSQFVPVGTVEDVHYATRLWDAMVRDQLEGESRKNNAPFFGGAKPHGEILELSYQNLTLGAHTGFIVVKRNYGKAGESGVRGVVTVERVSEDRTRYLDSITVMFQREAGFDEDHQNWFWVKYKPDGALFTKKVEGRLTALAGRLLKSRQGADNSGCIYCHSSAGGGDYIFYSEIIDYMNHQ